MSKTPDEKIMIPYLRKLGLLLAQTSGESVAPSTD